MGSLRNTANFKKLKIKVQKSENSILDYVYIRGKYISIFVSVYKETLKRYTKKLAIMWSGRGGRRLLFMLFFF